MPEPGSIEYARLIRGMRSRVLKKLEEGDYSLRDALRDPPAPLLGVDLWVLLTVTCGMGPKSARQVCERAKVWPHTELQAFSRRQRFRIIDELPERIT